MIDCGYSMNAIDGLALSTIHVTPEDGFSYASYEAAGFDPKAVGFGPLIKKVLKCFGPSDFSVAINCEGDGPMWGEDTNVEGYTCEEHVKEYLPGGGCIVYKCFSVADVGVGKENEMGCGTEEDRNAVSSPKSTLHCWQDVTKAVANEVVALNVDTVLGDSQRSCERSSIEMVCRTDSFVEAFYVGHTPFFRFSGR